MKLSHILYLIFAIIFAVGADYVEDVLSKLFISVVAALYFWRSIPEANE